MTIAKSGKKLVGIWGIVCILAISVCFLFSLIQSQKAYAETKKISGTLKLATALTNATFGHAGKTRVGVLSYLYVLSSTDPAWNNASFFSASITIDPTGQGDDYRVYGAITHPGGDQTFIESRGSWKLEREGEFNWSSESRIKRLVYRRYRQI